MCLTDEIIGKSLENEEEVENEDETKGKREGTLRGQDFCAEAELGLCC
jgi:hypothetical protein